MQLTKTETRLLVIAIGTAIEKENRALEALKREVQQLGIRATIAERTRCIRELDRLRERIRSEII